MLASKNVNLAFRMFYAVQITFLIISFISCENPIKDGSETALKYCNCNKLNFEKKIPLLEKFNTNFDNYNFRDKAIAKQYLDSLLNQYKSDSAKCIRLADSLKHESIKKYILHKDKFEKFDFAFNGQKLICKDVLYSEIMNKFSKIYEKIKTLPEGPIADIDGNVYKTVTIGKQVWMKENLRVTKFRNGNPINKSNSYSYIDQNQSKYFLVYENNNIYLEKYGRLYSYNTVIDTNGLCPTGWHVPSEEEWETLTDYLGGKNIAGGKLKESGNNYWHSPNAGADNMSGFSALPSGACNYNGSLSELGYSGNWWSVSQFNPANGRGRSLIFNSSKIIRGNCYKTFGLSVRCIKD